MGKITYCPMVGGKCNKSESEIEVQKDSFFFAEPFKPEQERRRRELAVKSALRAALDKRFSEDSLKMADKEPKEAAIFCDICYMIQSSAYGIVDISGLNPNVLIELGMMFSLDKPVFVLVKKSEEESLREKLPSNIYWMRVIPYEEFIDIEEKLPELIQNRPLVELEPSFRELPDNPEIALKMGYFCYQSGEYDDALKLYRWTLTLKPDFYEAWYDKGRVFHELGEYEEAVICYDKAIEIKEDYVEAWYNKGVALSRLEKYEEAITCYQEAIKIKEDDVEVWLAKGFALDELGEYEEAVICYDKAIEIKEDYVEAWYNKGVALSRLEKYEETITCYQEAIKIKEDDEKYWLAKGAAFSKLRRLKEAVDCYDKAKDIKEKSK